MKEIPLTQGKTALVDDCDHEMLMQCKWYAVYSPLTRGWYAAVTVGKAPHRVNLLMHRVILGARPGVKVDHKNLDGLNNTRGNLRLCTTSQNKANAGLISSNTSGYKGVSQNHKSRSWTAYIYFQGAQIYLGSFCTPQIAAAAYDQAAVRYFGEFALTNQALLAS